MKLEINGWGRVVQTHMKSVFPITLSNNLLTPDKAYGDLRWSDSTTAYGKVNGLKLSGNFSIKFKFEKEELRNWLLVAAESDPEGTLRLIGEAQAEAIIALQKRSSDT